MYKMKRKLEKKETSKEGKSFTVTAEEE